MQMRLLLTLVFLLPSLTAIPSAHATDIRAGDSIAITTPLSDDVYIAGSDVSVSERVIGDLAIVSGNASIDGNVAEDASIAAGKVFINGNIGDDLRVGGGEVYLRGEIGDDLILMAGDARIEETSMVRGDTIVLGGRIESHGSHLGSTNFRGGKILMDGTARDGLTIHGDAVTMNGVVLGETVIVATSLSLGENARFEGPVRYWTPQGEMDFGTALKGGTATFDPGLRIDTMGAAQSSGGRGKGVSPIQFASMLFAILLMGILILITKKFFDDATKAFRVKPWSCLGIGLLWYIGAPILTVAFFMTLVAWPISLLLLSCWIVSIAFGKMLASIVLSKWIAKQYGYSWNRKALFGVAVLCYLVLSLIASLPIIGWLAVFLLTLATFGAILRTKWLRMKKLL